jgi:uncharacterized membrane protein YdjX (TVP38/TMEM64 family)
MGWIGVALGVVAAAQVVPVTACVGAGAAGLRDAGALGQAAFAALYALVTVALVPASPLTVVAGATWGPWGGLVTVWPGATVGALVAFALARRAGRSGFVARAGAVPLLAALDEVLAVEGGRVTLLLRLSPLVPFGVLSYALGLSRVGAGRYAAATAIGIVPGTLLYTWIGATVGEIGTAAATGTLSMARTAFLGVGLVATLLAVLLLSRGARRALDARAGGSP